MACGCVVAGFTGFGAREFATTQNGFWAEEDDCLECAGQLARTEKNRRIVFCRDGLFG